MIQARPKSTFRYFYRTASGLQRTSKRCAFNCLSIINQLSFPAIHNSNATNPRNLIEPTQVRAGARRIRRSRKESLIARRLGRVNYYLPRCVSPSCDMQRRSPMPQSQSITHPYVPGALATPRPRRRTLFLAARSDGRVFPRRSRDTPLGHSFSCPVSPIGRDLSPADPGAAAVPRACQKYQFAREWQQFA